MSDPSAPISIARRKFIQALVEIQADWRADSTWPSQRSMLAWPSWLVPGQRDRFVEQISKVSELLKILPGGNRAASAGRDRLVLILDDRYWLLISAL